MGEPLRLTKETLGGTGHGRNLHNGAVVSPQSFCCCTLTVEVQEHLMVSFHIKFS